MTLEADLAVNQGVVYLVDSLMFSLKLCLVLQQHANFEPCNANQTPDSKYLTLEMLLCRSFGAVTRRQEGCGISTP